MASFKKMKLVPEMEYDRLKMKEVRDYDPELRTLSFLQSEIDDILNNSNLDAESKMRLFQAAQYRFSSIKERQPEEIKYTSASLPVPPTPVLVPPTPVLPPPAADPIPRDMNHDKILNNIPVFQRNKAENFLDLLTEDPDQVTYNNKYQLVVAGKPVKGSNIIDLIRNLYVKRKNYMPKGQRAFLTAIRRLNMPNTLIQNTEVLDRLKATKPRKIAAYKPKQKDPQILKVYGDFKL